MRDFFSFTKVVHQNIVTKTPIGLVLKHSLPNILHNLFGPFIRYVEKWPNIL